MTRMDVAGLLLLGFATGCNATNTGNPDLPPPKGVELVRSALQRERDPQVPDADLQHFASDNRNFALALYAQVRDRSGNLFLAPYSISTALAMAYAGARGDTATEMATAMHFGLPGASLHVAFDATDLALAERPKQVAKKGAHGVQLESFNAAWVQSGLEFHKDYLDLLALYYGAGIYSIDAMGDNTGTLARINDWVSDKTEGRIPMLFDQLPPTTALVLTNAVYFNADWLFPFDEKMTQDGTFHATAGDVTVPMMHGALEPDDNDNGPRYAEGTGYQAVELPYASPDVRMLCILPTGSLDALESSLSGGFLDSVLSALESVNGIQVSMPRFQYSDAFELNEPLKALGMQLAFSASADFSGMLDEQLYIVQVVHKTFIAVDEKHTEAAGASGVVLSRLGSLTQVALDRPFLYLIYDQPTGQILFLGRLEDPSVH